MTNTDIPPVLRPASKHLQINPLIAGRWSSRAIDPHKPIDETVLNRLFEAGRWAPSAFNSQPWRFLSFGPDSPNALEEARKALLEGNAWALSAPRLLFLLAKNEKSGNPRTHYEAGMAAIQMALQAAEEGLVFHQMIGFSADAVRKSFSVPDNFSIITAIAIGWPGSIDTVPENRRDFETSERIRMNLNELVFSNGEVPKE